MSLIVDTNANSVYYAANSIVNPSGISSDYAYGKIIYMAINNASTIASIARSDSGPAFSLYGRINTPSFTDYTDIWTADVGSSVLSSLGLTITYTTTATYVTECAFVLSNTDASTRAQGLSADTSAITFEGIGNFNSASSMSYTTSNNVFAAASMRYGTSGTPGPGTGWTAVHAATTGAFAAFQYKTVNTGAVTVTSPYDADVEDAVLGAWYITPAAAGGKNLMSLLGAY